jgi:hypothetical protein
VEPDPGGKIFLSGSGIKHPGSATLIKSMKKKYDIMKKMPEKQKGSSSENKMWYGMWNPHCGSLLTKSNSTFNL